MDLYDLQVHVPDFSFFILSLNIAETNLENAWSLSQSGMFKDVCMDMSPNNLLSIEQIYELQHHLHWYENFNYYELITTLQILF